MEFILSALVFYLFIGVILIAPVILFHRKPVIWNKSDLIIGLISLFIYIGVHTVGPGTGKGGAVNFIVESVLTTLILPIGAAVFLFY